MVKFSDGRLYYNRDDLYDLSYIVKKKEGGFSKNAIMMLVGHIKE